MSRENITTSFRISRDEAMLIRRGLVWLVAKHHRWKASGSALNSPAIFASHRPRIDEGEFSAECQATVLHVAVVTSNDFKAQSRRLRLDPIELAACIPGVRVTEMMPRHGHLKPCPSSYRVRSRRLLAKLERLLKRAKRAYIRVHGQRAFAHASHQWQQYVRFARAYFLFCTCHRTSFLRSGTKVRRRLIQDRWMEYFRHELPVRGLEIPPEPELRDLVRRPLRVGKRLIRYHGWKTAHDNPDPLQERMKNYVIRRCHRSKASTV